MNIQIENIILHIIEYLYNISKKTIHIIIYFAKYILFHIHAKYGHYIMLKICIAYTIMIG